MARSMPASPQLTPGQILVGPQFPESVRVETATPLGTLGREVGVVGARTWLFRRVALTVADLATLKIDHFTLSVTQIVGASA